MAGMLLYAEIIFFSLLCLLALNFLLNWLSIDVLAPNSAARTGTLVSVLVPARNEAHNISACLLSLMAQDYQNIEIIVLDDESADGTGDMVAALAAGDARVRLIKGEPLPPGWVGKNWACHQLYGAARGQWLLFTDADTRFAPGAIATSVNHAEASGAHLLSILPRQEAEATSVQLMIPLLYFTLYTLFPGALARRVAAPSISAAIGQFLLFRRDAYQAIGGHEAIAGSIVEDLSLARAIKTHKLRLVLADGHRLVSCKMYGSLMELWSGFTKNFYASFSYSIARLGAFLLMNAAVYLLPFSLLILYFLTDPLSERLPIAAMLTFQVTTPFVMRAALALRHPTSKLSLALHPVAITVMIMIGCNSMIKIVSGQGVNWKGRAYNNS